ncbi:hypothetical protein EJB05_21272, partial [Eragrostis curvula]
MSSVLVRAARGVTRRPRLAPHARRRRPQLMPPFGRRTWSQMRPFGHCTGAGASFTTRSAAQMRWRDGSTSSSGQRIMCT